MRDRFDNYKEITAKFSRPADCGHDVTKGQRIGYLPKYPCGKTVCADCWHKWRVENAEARAMESGLPCY